MAPQSMPHFDPFASLDVPDLSSEKNNGQQPEPQLSLAELAAALSGQADNELSVHLALDLILNDIVEQARLATGASSAAIALRRGQDIVCRATTGPSAPDLGVELDMYSGLSGACVQSRTFQRCDDSESDARVDAELCRRLGVRSILVFPILRQDELLGAVEVFSAKPQAFSDREVQTLQALARIVIHHIDHAAETIAIAERTASPSSEVIEMPPLETLQTAMPEIAEEEAITVPELKLEPEPEPELIAGPQTELPEIVLPSARHSDPWTTILTILVIVVALVLGWLIGHVHNLQRAAEAQQSAKPSAAQTVPDESSPTQHPVTSVPQQTQPATSYSQPATKPAPPKTDESKSEPAKPQPAASDLKVYENGKLIYHQPPQGNASSAATNTPAPKAPASARVQLSSDDANQYLINRVEPDYPDQARVQHIQGPVQLQIVVGKDGAVKSLDVLNGDPQLAQAASAAVRQWQFKPYRLNGQAQEFETLVTVSFRLPG